MCIRDSYDAGVDVHADDRLGLLGLSYDGIRARDAAVLRHYRGRGIPVATVIGGGYGTDLDEVAFRHSLVFHAALGEHARAPACSGKTAAQMIRRSIRIFDPTATKWLKPW